MNDKTISFEELKDRVGGETISDVTYRLDALGVRWLPGKRGRPFTTEFALNAAMGLSSITLESDLPDIEV